MGYVYRRVLSGGWGWMREVFVGCGVSGVSVWRCGACA